METFLKHPLRDVSSQPVNKMVRHIRVLALQAFEDEIAGHLRHEEVEQDQFDVPPVLLVNFDALLWQ
jgi:hypothetical protein